MPFFLIAILTLFLNGFLSQSVLAAPDQTNSMKPSAECSIVFEGLDIFNRNQMLNSVSESDFFKRLEIVLSKLESFENSVRIAILVEHRDPEIFLTESNALVADLSKLLRELGEENEIIEASIKLSELNYPGVLKEKEIKYHRISLGKIDVKHRRALNVIDKQMLRFDVKEVSFDIFRNIIGSTGGFFQAQHSYMSLGPLSINRLLLWDSKGFVFDHEITHARFEKLRNLLRSIYREKFGIADESRVAAFTPLELTTVDLVTAVSMHIDRQSHMKESTIENNSKYQGMEVYDFQFRALDKSFIPDALYKSFMSAEELYTFANNVWWSVKSFTKPEKLSGEKLESLVDHWYGLIISLENVARQTNIASKFFIKYIDKIKKEDDLDKLNNKQLGYQPSTNEIFLVSYPDDKMEDPDFMLSRSFYDGPEFLELAQVFEGRWKQDTSLDQSFLERPRPNRYKEASVISQHEAIDREAMRSLIFSYLDQMRADLVKLERTAAFYVMLSLQAQSRMIEFAQKLKDSGSFEELQLSQNTLAIFEEIKIFSRRLGLYVRPSFKAYLGKKEMEAVVPREDLEEYYKWKDEQLKDK